MSAGEIAALQVQAPFNLQAFTALDARTSAPNRAVRNAILTKFDRMEVVLTEGPDRGTICRLKAVPAGQTLVTFGQQNNHWDEQAPDDVLDPGPDPTAPMLDVPWAEARDAVLGLNGQPPLTTGSLIRIVDRPTDGFPSLDPPAILQPGDTNMGVFGGYIIVLVTNPQALEFTGRRVRTNPFTNQDETETVRYELLTDRVTRVVDVRGNDVRGDAGLEAFPFFLEWVTGNVVAVGGRLVFEATAFDFNEKLYSEANPAVGGQSIRNNSVESDAVLRIKTHLSAIDYEINGNQISNNATVYLFNVAPTNPVHFTSNQVSAPILLDSAIAELMFAGCRLADEINLSDLPTNALTLVSPTSPSGNGEPVTVLSFINQTLTPTESSLEVCIVPSNSSVLFVGIIPWVGTVRLFGRGEPDMTFDTVEGMPPRRPMRFLGVSPLTSGNTLQTITFTHNPPLLQGYNGETTVVAVATAGSATLLRVAPDAVDYPEREYVQVVEYLAATNNENNGGHIIFDGNTPDPAEVPVGALRMPQRPHLIFQGAGVNVADQDTGKDATIITIDGVPGSEGRGYQTTSGTANTLTAGTKTLVCDTPAARLAYQPGARVRASATADPAGKFMEGIVTAAAVVADVLTLAVAIDYVSGISATPISAWNLNVAGEKPLYTEGQVDYAAGTATLRLETGSLFEVDLNTPALGAAGTVTLDYTGAATGKSVLIRIKQKAAAPFRQLAYAAGKFETPFAYAVPLTQTANAVDQLTGLFHRLGVGGRLSLVYKPNVQVL